MNDDDLEQVERFNVQKNLLRMRTTPSSCLKLVRLKSRSEA